MRCTRPPSGCGRPPKRHRRLLRPTRSSAGGQGARASSRTSKQIWPACVPLLARDRWRRSQLSPGFSPCWTRAKTRDSPLELALALSEPQPKSVAPAPSSGLAARSPSRFPPARRAWPVPSAATKGAISHDGGAVIPCDHEDLLAAPRSSRRVAAGRPGPPQPGARMDESSTLPSSQRAPSSQRSLVKDVSHPSNAAPPGAGLAWHRASDPRSAASSRQDERRILRYSRRFSSRRRSQWK